MRSSMMNVRICAVQITCRSLQPIWLRLPHEPRMLIWMKCSPCDRHPELQWHIKARSCSRCNADFDAREIVDGIAAAFDQRKDSVQSARATWNFGSHVGNQFE